MCRKKSIGAEGLVLLATVRVELVEQLRALEGRHVAA